MLQPTSQRKKLPMEWLEGRITKRSVDAAQAPETRAANTELAFKADKLDLSSARERILELALQHQHSAPTSRTLKLNSPSLMQSIGDSDNNLKLRSRLMEKSMLS